MRFRVVLVPFPFDDLSGQKVRPAVCLTNPIGVQRHIVLAFITSAAPATLESTDVPLTPVSPDFGSTGLRVPSTLRPHRLVTVTTSIIHRQIGSSRTDAPGWKSNKACEDSLRCKRIIAARAVPKKAPST